jgi:hypothetical protein
VEFSSKKQTGVALSSIEAELVAGSQECTSMKFVGQLLDEIIGEGKRVLPSRLAMDNQGAIHIMHNNAVMPRTKHVDIRTRFVQDMVSKGELEVNFLNSEENASDIATKSVTEALFEKHAESIQQGLFHHVECQISSKEDVKYGELLGAGVLSHERENSGKSREGVSIASKAGVNGVSNGERWSEVVRRRSCIRENNVEENGHAGNKYCGHAGIGVTGETRLVRFGTDLVTRMDGLENTQSNSNSSWILVGERGKKKGSSRKQSQI